MSFSTALLPLMPSTVKVSTRTGHATYGAPTFAATTTNYRARVLEAPGYLRDDGGEGLAYRHVAWVRSTGVTSITASDRVTLPDGTKPPVLRVERFPDPDGEHHVKVFFG